MLEPWIIEQIRRREEEERRRERPRLEIPSRDERWKPDHEEHDKPVATTKTKTARRATAASS